jgi:hypothetical protein
MVMDQGTRKQKGSLPHTHDGGTFDLDALLHPAKAFAHPMDVVRDPDLTLNEKRAVLASWASDVCAVEADPDPKQPADGPRIRFDDIMDALKQLDADAAKKSHYGKLINRARRIRDLYRPDGNGGVMFG